MKNENSRRGRPKGKSKDQRSYGPLGDLLRRRRLELGLGLSDVSKACRCSVQFISNIEHGRAPLPWDKVPAVASFLKLQVSEVQAANLAMRSDFKGFVSGGGRALRLASASMTGAASAIALGVQDENLRKLLARYQTATPAARKKFVTSALRLLGD